MNFKNKTAIVTGATRGIGQKIAEDLYDLGATLILTGADRDRIKRLRGNKRRKYYHLDFLEDESVSEFIETLEEYEKIDICINNAGINRINYIYDIMEEDWDRIMKVNLSGPFRLIKEAARIMKKKRYGRIVNIASIYGTITREKRAAYTASKSGLIGLTKTAALDLAPYNILVNSVSPGFILTDLTKRILSSKEREALRAAVPLKRLGRPRDISPVVLFLASDLNTYITGQNIIADGGYVNT